MGDMKSTSETVFFQDQLVNEFQETCEPRQRALLSLLAICEKHHLAPTQLVASLSHDLPRTPLESRRKTRGFFWSRVLDISDELERVQAVPDALEKFPGLLPNTVELALRLERETGTLPDLIDAWLNRPPDYVCDAKRNESFVARMFPLFLKTLVVFYVVVLVLIKIFPEFRSMMEEFGVDAPPIFQLTAMICNALNAFWFIPALLILIAIPFCVPAISRYCNRWNPFVWQQPILPSAVSTRQALALVIAHGKSISTNALKGFWKLHRTVDGSDAEISTQRVKPFDWDKLALRRIISNKEARALQMADSDAAQAWLLQKSAIKKYHRIEGRGMFFTRAVVTSANVFLGTLIFLLALSIFSTLISIMSQLQ